MLKIEESWREKSAVLVLSGTVDMYGSPDLKARLDDLADRKPSRLVLDLAGVDFIDSSGLAALVSAQRRMRKTEGRLLLAAPTPRVRDVFDLMQLTSLFTIRETTEEALSA